MSFLRLLSVGVALISALLAGALAAYCASPQLSLVSEGWLPIVIGAGAVACVVGLAHWLVISSYEMELRHVVSRFDVDTEAGAETPTFNARFGLSEVSDIVTRSIRPTRERLAQISTERRQFEMQARVSEAQRRHLEAILNAIIDPVIVTDAFNDIVLANDAAARTLHFSLPDAVCQPLDKVVHDPSLVKLIKDAREGGHAALRRHVEHRVGRNGHAATFNVTLACVTAAPSPNGNATTSQSAAGVVTILRDVTREKEIAEMKSEFVANVSHELRTPLSSIKAYMEMLVDGEAQDDQTRAEFYNIIQGEANRLSRLIDNILNINRIEAGVVKVQREQIDLQQIVRESVEIMLPQARAKQIELTLKSCSDDCRIFADSDMIHQAVLNLIGNAIKYTPEHGNVKVAIGHDKADATAWVSVEDTGVGIGKSDLPYIYEKFYRVADHKKLAKGTGLGLPLVKHVIETVHCGKVSVISEVGKGSTFTFSLPVIDNG